MIKPLKSGTWSKENKLKNGKHVLFEKTGKNKKDVYL